MRWLLAIALVGCGSSKPKTTTECYDCGDGPGGMNDRYVQEKQTHEFLCGRIQAHAAAECSPFDQMDPKLMTGTCGAVTSFQMAGMDQCLGEKDCAGLQACFAKTRADDAPPTYRGPTRACELPKDHADLALPAGFSHDEIVKSHGYAARTYADAPSSKDKPIEVCGFPAAGGWLARMTCADGSHPFPSRTDAERARVGNVGEGGRCGRIIDHYAVECAEATYDVFIDSYRCPL